MIKLNIIHTLLIFGGGNTLVIKRNIVYTFLIFGGEKTPTTKQIDEIFRQKVLMK